jgi:hypothetical protein
MMPPPPPPTDDILEALPPSNRPSISWAGALVGLVLGLVIGLVYAWQIDPVVVRNVAPADLQSADQQAYIVSAALEYSAKGDLQQAVERLLEVAPDQNPFEVAANTTCELIRTGQVDDVGDIEVIRSLRSIYEPQGVQAPCDTQAFNTPVPVTLVIPSPTITFTPSITPVASKTPTLEIAPAPVSSPLPNSTQAVGGTRFREAFLESYCDPANNGLIEVYVRDSASNPLSGVAILIADNQRREALFYSGLKPERGEDYADFQMEAGQSYRLGIEGEGMLTRAIDAIPCDAAGTLASYRVVLQQVAPEGESSN